MTHKAIYIYNPALRPLRLGSIVLHRFTPIYSGFLAGLGIKLTKRGLRTAAEVFTTIFVLANDIADLEALLGFSHRAFEDAVCEFSKRIPTNEGGEPVTSEYLAARVEYDIARTVLSAHSLS